MACFQISRSALSPRLALRSGLSHRLGFVVPLRCALQDPDSNPKGEERPESLFMKELRRRGMSPGSVVQERERIQESIEEEEEGRGIRRRSNGVASTADDDKSLDGQRERSMSLNSEGLEGLVPRTKLLLTIGGTFFLGFWPLILVTSLAFGILYIYFGPSFVHDASMMSVSPPPYVDPYTLLEDEEIFQVAPYIK